MKTAALFAALVLLTGCATQPKPPVCRGDFRPVNKPRVAAQLPDVDARLALCPVNMKGANHG